MLFSCEYNINQSIYRIQNIVIQTTSHIEIITKRFFTEISFVSKNLRATAIEKLGKTTYRTDCKKESTADHDLYEKRK